MKRNGSCPSLEKINKIKLGICAMEKKVKSSHMKNILDNFNTFEEFKIIIFTEEIIFKKEIEHWPIVDASIIFFSEGFPLNKGLK
jgi:inositol hexakisphosphate/diphosphoinositol-pentakisphosphate kinase